MRKIVSFALVLIILMLRPLILSPVSAAPPVIKRPMELIAARNMGDGPETVDPAWCNDEASKELIFNVYETLLFFDGERLDIFIPQLATEWKVEDITGTTSPEGLPWYFRYTFQIRTNVTFHNGYTLTPADIEYTFERAMVQDRIGGPTWMFYEPLLNTWGAEGLGDIGNCTNPGPDVQLVGNMIDHAVESNDTHVWFNIAFPGVYAPFLQILTQSWSSILSKGWINDYVIGILGRPEWSGEWGDYTGWICYHNPEVSPLDVPMPIMCGTGPFEFVILDYDNMYWSVDRSVEYWRGWPADWPAPPYPSRPGNIRPAGYVDRLNVTWAYSWPVREAMFLSGDVDFCAVPRDQIGAIVGQPGMRCTYPLPGLSVGSMFFTFDVDATSAYENVYESGFHEDGMPRDFFGNEAWGIHTRLGFTYVFDFDTYLATSFLGEAIGPATAIIPGLLCYDPSVLGYKFNLTAATEEFKKVPGLWDTGFTVVITYPTGNTAMQNATEKLRDGINLLGNTKFHVDIVSISSKTYRDAMVRHQLAVFYMDWSADFPDPHDFAFPFYHSAGTFAAAQLYSNPTMDALIEAGIRAPPAERCAIYHDIQVLARQETPSVPIYDAIGRHFERDWVVGWYYNVLYPGTPTYQGIYAYPLWKWYYVPQSTYDDYAPYTVSNRLPSDVNYDGKVDDLDFDAVTRAYGSYYGPPPHWKWNFRCDVSNDRQVNMQDTVVKDYGKTSAIWMPPPLHGGDIYLVAEPSKETAGINYTVRVAVKINNATDLTGYEIRLLYNPNLTEPVNWNIEPIPGWDSTRNYTFQGWGALIVACWLASGSPYSGNATLVTFEFKGLAKGNTTIDISKSTIETGEPLQATPYNPINCEVRVILAGDYDENGKVDMKDIGYICLAYGSYPGHPKWNPNADINDDGKVDMKDIGIACMHYGQHYP